jgi:glycosyltransferase involved in cell wall biosynthesis
MGKKILVITGTHPKDGMGGAEVQAYFIARGLKELEKDTIFCAVDSNYETAENIEGGLEYISLNSKKILLSRMRDFYRLVKEKKPEVIYVRTLYSFWWINLVAKVLRIPTVYHISSVRHCQYLTWHEHRIWTREKHWLKYLKKMVKQNFYVFNSRFADAIVCQTHEQVQMIKKNFKREGILIRSGQPLPSRLPDKPEREFRVVWIGKYWKNPEIFGDLAKSFSGKNGLLFFMIGIFPEKDAQPYSQMDKEVANFTFFGELSHDGVEERLDEAHVMVNTSEYEGFSNTFIEAWMRGVPIISLKVNPDNLLTEEKIGFHSQSIEQMGKDLMKLYEDRKLYAEYSQNSYRYAAEHHDIKKVSRHIRDLVYRVSERKQA